MHKHCPANTSGTPKHLQKCQPKQNLANSNKQSNAHRNAPANKKDLGNTDKQEITETLATMAPCKHNIHTQAQYTYKNTMHIHKHDIDPQTQYKYTAHCNYTNTIYIHKHCPANTSRTPKQIQKCKPKQHLANTDTIQCTPKHTCEKPRQHRTNRRKARNPGNNGALQTPYTYTNTIYIHKHNINAHHDTYTQTQYTCTNTI